MCRRQQNLSVVHNWQQSLFLISSAFCTSLYVVWTCCTLKQGQNLCQNWMQFLIKTILRKNLLWEQTLSGHGRNQDIVRLFRSHPDAPHIITNSWWPVLNNHLCFDIPHTNGVANYRTWKLTAGQTGCINPAGYCSLFYYPYSMPGWWLASRHPRTCGIKFAVVLFVSSVWEECWAGLAKAAKIAGQPL